MYTCNRGEILCPEGSSYKNKIFGKKSLETLLIGEIFRTRDNRRFNYILFFFSFSPTLGNIGIIRWRVLRCKQGL